MRANIICRFTCLHTGVVCVLCMYLDIICMLNGCNSFANSSHVVCIGDIRYSIAISLAVSDHLFKFSLAFRSHCSNIYHIFVLRSGTLYSIVVFSFLCLSIFISYFFFHFTFFFYRNKTCQIYFKFSLDK